MAGCKRLSTSIPGNSFQSSLEPFFSLVGDEESLGRFIDPSDQDHLQFDGNAFGNGEESFGWVINLLGIGFELKVLI